MRSIEVMDTTLRDGEQTPGVSYTPGEKLQIARFLLKEVGVDRIEIASCNVSSGELEAVSRIVNWAKSEGAIDKVEVLGFVDYKKSVDWLIKAECKVLNLLTKGSKRHLEKQLRKTLKQHIKDIEKTIEYAKMNNIMVNAYLEDWSNGIQEDEDYVMELTSALLEFGVKRVMLPDTLGILTPYETEKYIKKMKERFPKAHFDFHPHNDYGLATANVLFAVLSGINGIHTTVNGLGERAGNVDLAQVSAVLRDKANVKINIREEKLVKISELVERFSGKRIANNSPIVGSDVFTQTAGVHADGDLKANLYHNPLKPERFGRKRSYALTKLAGMASIEHNLRELGIELSEKNKKLLLEKIKELGDKKKYITPEDIPFIVADILDRHEFSKIKIKKSIIMSGKGLTPTAGICIEYEGKEIDAFSEGDGGYDAMMKALRKCAERINIELPILLDYEVRIPKGGHTDALVETKIVWKKDDRVFSTIGVDTDQIVAAMIATEKMLNIVADWKSFIRGLK